MSTINETQASWAALEVASMAKAIQRMAVMLVDCEDQRDVEALLTAIQTVSSAQGMVADRICEKLQHAPPMFGSSVEDWLMPPAYFDPIKQENQS